MVSYHAAAGATRSTRRYFNARVDNRRCRRSPNGADGGNGVYRYGPSGFPDQTFNATNYWVDATSTARSRRTRVGRRHRDLPGRERHRPRPRVLVTASFDEPLHPASVTPTASR